MTQQAKHRPFLVTLLAILAGIVGVLSVIHALQGPGILPFFSGSFKVRNFDLWYAFMWGLMAWAYFWLVQMFVARRSLGLVVHGRNHDLQSHCGFHDDLDQRRNLFRCEREFHFERAHPDRCDAARYQACL